MRLGHQGVEPVELFVIELGGLGERHVGSRDAEIVPRRQLADPGQGAVIRHPHPTHPGVEVEVGVDGTTEPRGQPAHPGGGVVGVQTEGDVVCHQLDAVGVGEHPHEQDGFLHA